MGRPRGRPKRQDREDEVTVKIYRSLASKAKLIAGHRGASVADVLSELLQAPIDRAYAAMLRELEAGDKE